MDWIKCSDKLPEKYEMVIVYGRYTKGCPKKAFEAQYNPKLKCFFSGFITKCKGVTHWMPLPEPPI